MRSGQEHYVSSFPSLFCRSLLFLKFAKSKLVIGGNYVKSSKFFFYCLHKLLFSAAGLNIKLKKQHVAVLNNVVFAFDAVFSGFADFRFGAVFP